MNKKLRICVWGAFVVGIACCVYYLRPMSGRNHRDFDDAAAVLRKEMLKNDGNRRPRARNFVIFSILKVRTENGKWPENGEALFQAPGFNPEFSFQSETGRKFTKLLPSEVKIKLLDHSPEKAHYTFEVIGTIEDGELQLDNWDPSIYEMLRR